MNVNDLREQVSVALIRARLSKDLGEHELAKIAGVSQTVISHMETAQRSVTYSTLVKLANALGMRVRITFEEVPSGSSKG